MEIRIGKGARICCGCERAFVHQEELFSLVRLADEDFVREDYCASCWLPGHGRTAYSTWSPTFYDPKVAEQEPPEVFSPLRQLFYEAVESDDRTDLAMAFLGAQLLKRQKVFRLIKESDEPDSETRVILYGDRIGNRLIEVRDPNFTYAELETARTALMDKLRELEAPEEPEEEQSEDAHAQVEQG